MTKAELNKKPKKTLILMATLKRVYAGGKKTAEKKTKPQLVNALYKAYGKKKVSGNQYGNITYKNTSTTGTTLMDIPTGVTAGTLEPYIPDNGVLFNAGAYINAAANVQEGVTVFYDG